MKKVKRALSMLLVFCMVLGYVPGTVFAEGEEHTHNWSYSAEGAVLTAVCVCQSDPVLGDTTATAQLTITQNSVNGDAPGGCYLSGTEDWVRYFGTDAVPAISYIGTGETVYNSVDAPTEAGTYRAEITVDTVTASLDYTLHYHSWKVTGKNSGILTFTCLAENCPNAGEHILSVNAQSKKYDGENLTVSAAASENWPGDLVIPDNPQFWYTATGSGYTPVTDGNTAELGYYEARYTVLLNSAHSTLVGEEDEPITEGVSAWKKVRITEKAPAVTAMQERVDALPTVEAVMAMAEDEIAALSELLNTLCDDYYDGLTEDEQAQVVGFDVVGELFDALGAYETNLLASDWANLQSQINQASDGATIKLTKDYVAGPSDSRLTIAKYKEITIDLNGHKIDRNLTEAVEHGQVIYVDKAASLTITDTSSSHAGKITGGYDDDSGGGIYCASTSELMLYSGSICGNSAQYEGAGIFLTSYAKFYMYGGSIQGNETIEGSGSAIRLYWYSTAELYGGIISGNKCGATDSYSAGALSTDEGTCYTLGGTIQIYGNTNNGVEKNFIDFNISWQHSEISKDRPLATGAKIGVYKLWGSSQIGGLTEDNLKYFKSDVSGFKCIIDEDGWLAFEEQKHTWTYTASGAALYATCDKGCPEATTHTATLTLSANNANYTGNAVAATLSSTLQDDAFTALTITYAAKPGAGSLTNGKAVNAGSYTAMVTAGSVTAKKDFTISKIDYTGTKTASAELKATSGATADVTLPALPAGASYGTAGNSSTSLFTVGAVSGGKVTVTSAKKWNPATDAGDKTFLIPVTGATNYNTYFVTVTLTPIFHTHSFAYSVPDTAKNTIKATCVSTDDYCSLDQGSGEKKVTLTLTAASQTYTGSPLTPAITIGTTTEKTAWTGADLTLPTDAQITKTYFAADTAGSKTGSALPSLKDAGDYIVEVTYKYGAGENDKVTASVPFTINKATPTITANPTASAITYGQTLSDSTLTGGVASVAGTFTWKTGTTAPAVSDSDSTTYTVVFTPNDTANYNSKEITVKLSVNKASQEAPAADAGCALNYIEETLIAAAGCEVSSTNGADVTALTNNQVNPGSEAKTYYVRKAADANHNASAWTPVPIAARPAAPAAPTLSSKTDTTITVVAVAGQEYSKDNGSSWQDGGVFTGLTANTQYSIITRVKATETSFKSENSAPLVVTTKTSAAAAPNAEVTARTTNSITVTQNAAWEYKLGDGQWQDSNEFTGLTAATEYTIKVRVKETATAMASNEQTITTATKPIAPASTDGYTINYIEETIAVTNGYEVGTVSSDVFTKLPDTAITPNTEYAVRKAANGIIPASDPVPFTTAVRPDAPGASTVLDRTHTTFTLEAKDGVEYSIDGGANWKVGTEEEEKLIVGFTGLENDTEYTVLSRVKATETSFHGEQTTQTVRTKKATPGDGHALFAMTLPDDLTYSGTEKTVTVTAADGITGLGTITAKIYDWLGNEAAHPVDAGNYIVKASAAVGDSYNAIEEVEVGSFTIAKKSIADAVIVLDNVLVANGDTQTQNIKSVTVTVGEGADAKVLPVTYEVTGNTGKDAGSYTLTVTGTGNFEGTATKTFVILPAPESKPETNSEGAVVVGNGSIDVEAKGVTLNTDKASVIASVPGNVLTADILSEVAGGYNVDIVLNAKEFTPGETDKELVAKKLGRYKVGEYLDVNLNLLVNGVFSSYITELNAPISVSVKLPDSLINTNGDYQRTYAVIRVHGGEAEVLDATFNASTKMLTFKTDRFSTYSVVYKDTWNPKTGDTKTTILWAGVMLLGLMAIGAGIALPNKKRYTGKYRR